MRKREETSGRPRKGGMGRRRRGALIALSLGLSALPALALATPAGAAPTPTAPFNQCPAIGADASCALLIDATGSGATVLQDSTQGPFDSIEDTLIGVLNQSSNPLAQVTLSAGSSGIYPFAFDGDGICSGDYGTWGPAPASTTVASDVGSAGCLYNGDTTTYAGPDTSFTNISGDDTMGSVTFTPPLPPGKSTYFSLEDQVTAQSITLVPPTITFTGPSSISSTEGATFTGTVTTFTDTNTASTASEYSAEINWGDGSMSAGTVSSTNATGGPYTVSGSHTYAEEGSYTATVTITDSLNSSNDLINTVPAMVADAALTAACATPSLSTLSFSGSTATFTDANPSPPLSDFSAVITWGDGTMSSGTITGPVSGVYTVSGTHTYTSSIFDAVISTKINDVGGSTATASGCSVGIGRGAFVIGVNNSSINSKVTFWGAQWAKDNPLSPSAPASFKGYAIEVNGACGSTWVSTTGNSAPPPPGPLASTIPVIVASSVKQTGSVISGNIVSIVTVATNPGYAPDPGHAGTGKVVAKVC